MAQNKLILGAAAVAVIALGAGVYFSQTDSTPTKSEPATDGISQTAPPPADAPASSSTSAVAVSLDGPTAIIGAPDAPVTVIEYASMTCSHCATFHQNHFPAIKQEYIDTGKVKFEFRPFPLDGLALRASAVAVCGGASKFLAYTKTYFDTQGTWAFGSGDKIEQMANVARLGGMSRADFDACIDDQDLLKQIIEVRAEGIEEYNVNATPSFIIDGKTISGEMTLENFARHVDPLLPADDTE